MVCKLCKNNKFDTLFYTNNFEIQKCTRCGLVRTSNFLTPDYSHYHRDEEYADSEIFIKNIFYKRFNIISSFISKKGGKVLDIGAATGTMLDIFREQGWETFGVEPSASYKLAQKKGHTIYNTSFEKVRFKESFDVVIVNHVLEHIEDPMPFLAKVHKILEPKGVFYVDVPNFSSLSSKLSGKNWKYLLPREHVHHFTPETLIKLLINAKFKVAYIETRSGIFETAYPGKYLFDELTHLKKNFFFDTLGIPGNILATTLNQGTSIGVLVKK